MASDREAPAYDPASEVVDLCRELIRIDTTNDGDDAGPGERKAAEYVARLLDEVGIESPRSSSPSPAAPRSWRRWGGRTRRAPTRCCCTATSTWCRPRRRTGRSHPFSGEIHDGYVWGRGAVDMKDFDAMLLSVVRARAARRRAVPDRPIVLCFTADEEAGGLKGAEVLVERPPRAASRAAPRRSARSAASAPPSGAGGST